MTDTQVMVEGLCFTGMIQQTLIPDAMGNFNLTGSFSPMIGPAGGTAIGSVFRLDQWNHYDAEHHD